MSVCGVYTGAGRARAAAPGERCKRSKDYLRRIWDSIRLYALDDNVRPTSIRSDRVSNGATCLSVDSAP
jgi:hypothetical protein